MLSCLTLQKTVGCGAVSVLIFEFIHWLEAGCSFCHSSVLRREAVIFLSGSLILLSRFLDPVGSPKV